MFGVDALPWSLLLTYCGGSRAQIKEGSKETHLCEILLQTIYFHSYFYTILLCLVFYTYSCICSSTENLGVVL
jgi:hypothetical protein